MLVGAAGKDEVLGAAGFVVVACHDDGTIVGCGFAANEPLGIEGSGSAGAVGHHLGDVS